LKQPAHVSSNLEAATGISCPARAEEYLVARVVDLVPGGYGDSNTAVVKLTIESLVSGAFITFHPLGEYPFSGVISCMSGAQAPKLIKVTEGYPVVVLRFIDVIGDLIHSCDTAVR